MKFDVRKLNVGDFVWVAKEKVVPLPGQGNKISAPVINMSAHEVELQPLNVLASLPGQRLYRWIP